ncbi:MAG: hypothetical protein ACR2JE_12765 [Acidobacteriaceae bacterium]
MKICSSTYSPSARRPVLLVCRWALIFSTLTASMTPLYAGDIYTNRGTFVKAGYCKSGYGVHFSDQEVCLDKSTKLDFASLVDQTLTFDMALHGVENTKIGKLERYKVLALNPNGRPGHSYHHYGLRENLGEALMAGAGGLAAAGAAYPTYTPPPAYAPPRTTRPSTAQTQQQSNTPAVLTAGPLQARPQPAATSQTAAQRPAPTTAAAQPLALPPGKASDLGSGISSPGYCDGGTTNANYYITNNSYHPASVSLQVRISAGGVQNDFTTTQNVAAQSTVQLTQPVSCTTENNMSDFGQTAITQWQFY